MKRVKIYQCRTDLKRLRELLNMTKIEVANRVFCSQRTLERIEFENATPNKETAKMLAKLYNLEFDAQFYENNPDFEIFIKKYYMEANTNRVNKIIGGRIYYCIYIKKTELLKDSVWGRGVWVKNYNKNKEVRVLREINVEYFLANSNNVPIINEGKEWFPWYGSLTIGKVHKVIVSHECMEESLRNCLDEVIVKRENLFYWEGSPDMMLLGLK